MADTPSTSHNSPREVQRTRQRNRKPDERNIDGGLAYLTVVASFVCYLLFTGTAKGLGILLPTLKEHFDTHTWLVGLVISFVMTLMDFSSLFAGVLSYWVPSRYMVMTSGVSVATGLILASFAQTITQFGIFLVLFTGVGYGFTTIIIETELARHFRKKYACANGLATTGSSVGLFVMAPLMQYLLDVYGWTGALLILGGLSMNLVVCGTLLRPCSTTDEKVRNEVDNHPGELEEEPDSVEVVFTESPPKTRRASWLRASCGFRSGFERLTRASDIALFKEFSFCVLVTVACSIRFVFSAWTIYFVPHALGMGFDKIQASLFVIITAVGSFFGKACYGPIVDRRLVTIRAMIFSSTTVTAVVLILDQWMTTPAAMIAGCLVNGIAMGVATSMIQVFLKKVVGVTRVANSLGWTNFMSGFVRLAAGFFPGWIYDQTNSYNYPFVVIGCVSAVCPLVLTAEYFVKRWSRRASYDLHFTDEQHVRALP